MAKMPTTISINVTGNLAPIVNAFTLLADALDVHSHQWTEEERAAWAEASRLCENADVRQRNG